MDEENFNIEDILNGFPEIQRDCEGVYLGKDPAKLENPEDFEDYSQLHITFVEKTFNPKIYKLFGKDIEAVPPGAFFAHLAISDPNAIPLSFWQNYGRTIFKSELMRLGIGNDIFRFIITQTLDEFFEDAKKDGGLKNGDFKIGKIEVPSGIYEGRIGILEVCNFNVEDADYNINRRNFYI